MNIIEKADKTKERRIKQYEELTFTDNFMFCKIMENNPDVCKKVLEIILGKRIKEISFVSKESTIDIKWNGKSVHLTTSERGYQYIPLVIGVKKH